MLTQPKKHLFTVSMRRLKDLPGNSFPEVDGRQTPKHPFLVMQLDGENFLFKSTIPLFAKEFDLS